MASAFFFPESVHRHACLANPRREPRKSLSDDARQNPAPFPECSRSLASMIDAESVAFFPTVKTKLLDGAGFYRVSFQPLRSVVVRPPWARLTVALP